MPEMLVCWYNLAYAMRKRSKGSPETRFFALYQFLGKESSPDGKTVCKLNKKRVSLPPTERIPHGFARRDIVKEMDYA